ncbi:hypothetical protein FA10DRAFT_258391 [Acaromyces ingoldii]|uniref:Uncharacterized protein n=1 Tax=Acaromyces ingoldii TaxID=215250 RepID=A0A316YYF4_9BASI|nr:hypothetical protein FA10DRAFT_258391 [Acaromyces ingoldii]PWN94279.1 hypothetical protein FA10DRAFT_258391 [Acaromyces ingoldii]
MKLTLFNLLALGCWLTFAVHALAAGRQPGIYSPWESPQHPPSSWDHTKNDDRHVIADHTGAKDKGKGIASGSRRRDAGARSPPPSHEALFPTNRFFMNEFGAGPDAPDVNTLAQWNFEDDCSYDPNYPIRGRDSTLGEWSGFSLYDQSRVPNAWPGNHDDPRSQHLPSSDYQDAQYTTSYQASGVPRTESKSHQYSPDHSPSLVSKGILLKAPPSWYISVVDNPFGAIEERSMFKESALSSFVSEWAIQKRNQLALDRESDQLDFMRLDRSTGKWVMKENYAASDASEITRPTAEWFSVYANPNPVEAFKKRRMNCANDMRKKRKKAAEKRRQGH